MVELGKLEELGYELSPQEYIVKDVKKLGEFIDREFGIEYEITEDDACADSGSVLVFAPLVEEHREIRNFATENRLWIK